ncbi:hypothetical protein J1780_09145 [Rahnella aceris]|jgi:hypothetical protein|uniref:hypothetical protein n=1 Tax=Rahnella sp. (strain Y9602) TaxID=2703885 RepID=UPI001C27B1CC|nr:hypothetical protein [Rahnella aceris]MBU9840119.1 hypothetical protein [Rahnella aceris]
MPFFKKKTPTLSPHAMYLAEREKRGDRIKARNLQKSATLQSWAVLPERHVLVHTFELQESPFCRQDAASLFNSWDVFSTSLVDLNDIKKFTTESFRYTGMYHNIALVLDVPRQNILGTFPRDVWFMNHAGREGCNPQGRVLQPYGLVECIQSGRGVGDFRCEGGYQQLLTPAALMTQDKVIRNQFTHNEILIIGRQGLNLYDGLPATQSIRVTRVLGADKRQSPDYSKVPAGHMKTTEEIGKHVARLNNVPFEML